MLNIDNFWVFVSCLVLTLAVIILCLIYSEKYDRESETRFKRTV